MPPGTIVSAKGEPAAAMYFIVSGELEVELAKRHLQFGAGDFFGELALLHKTMRSATVVTLTQCRLLTLTAGDFNHLVERHPGLRQQLRHNARPPIKAFSDADDIAQAEVDEAGFWREDMSE